MIAGRVNSALDAVILLRLRSAEGKESTLQAVIDTGFNDCLILSPAVVAQLELPFVDTCECELAENHVVTRDGFEASVEWHGVWREVLALSSEGDPLVGMSLLHGSRLTIDVRTEGTVTIAILPE